MANKMNRHLSLGGMLVTLGIVYGDIGTSPLYVMQAILSDAEGIRHAVPDYIIGSVSLIFWTLMIITTVKYVIIAMRADNNHEGGIFALYALIRNRARWLIFPALIGGAALLADGTLTPAVSVTSAIEGLKGQHIGSFEFSENQLVVVLVVTAILLGVFLIQHFGTAAIGRSFGPIMLLWFVFIGATGFINMLSHLEILKALSPYYAVQFLFSPANKAGVFILGSVFLATTGAEALYSDMGHVGRKNIYGSWPFVSLMLMLSYMGQGAWVIGHYQNPAYRHLLDVNPFYEMLPDHLRFVAIALATFAAIIASQALITGSYTLVNEAIGLKFLPRMVIKHPSMVRSQIYISAVNGFLCVVTLSIVWLFQTSRHMEAAYGLSITITMLMTTILLFVFVRDRFNQTLALCMALFFGSIETLFLLASLVKFVHGGYLTLLITLLILAVMVVWYFGNKLRENYEKTSENVSLMDYRKQLIQLSNDHAEPIYATNLVYMTKVGPGYSIKRKVLYSILDKRPKRAKVYWFVTVNETDAPYRSQYTIDMLGTRNIINVQLYLGFKNSQHVNVYIRQIINDLIDQKIIDTQYPKYTTLKNRRVGDFKFVVTTEQLMDLATDPKMNRLNRFLIGGRIFLQNITTSPAIWYGLKFSEVVEEPIPLMLYDPEVLRLQQKGVRHAVKDMTNPSTKKQ
ncbi:KUP/HAK/KT family potassium transporter [Sporolactobacillus inulinus]|uniref:Probable potassium transport system protein Kup n=1 Tax=Sporolactobacillus inulinus CASD TaxID=1069536 RepID=A0A0U1QLD9_9BACL|nr:KUP/HAK/KT family potassium transporter [Sporolactobacillus inulinus]KLI01609.1 potassium transporter Kup [Sporolactobacillus inulinus CASD]GEB77067.1 putative potassium transport system protein kup 2 [Sporolactobacillus inulinus]